MKYIREEIMALKSSHRLLIPLIIVIGCIVGILLVIDPVTEVNAKPINPGSSFMAVSDEESAPVMKSVNASVLTSRISQPVRRMADAQCVLDDTGVISHWQLNESAGATTFQDIFGGHNGLCNSGLCPTATNGIKSGAFEFNAATQTSIYVPLPQVPAQEPNDDFDWTLSDNISIGLWVKTNQDCSGNKVYVGRYRISIDNATWWVGCAAATNKSEVGVAVFRFRDATSTPRQVNGTSRINDGQWHYLVGVRNGSSDTNYLYVDGVLENSLTSPDYSEDFFSDRRITFGGYDEPHDYYFTGILDEISIYHRALSYAEILVNYKHCSGEPFTTFLPLSLK